MQKSKINFFKDEYKMLSNFYPVELIFDGRVYKSLEHAYQAAKTKDEMIRMKFSNLEKNEAGKAKRLGRYIKKRDDWNLINISIMKNLLRQKFNLPGFKEFLLSTGDSHIEEGNYWHDNFWGDCYCKKCIDIKGENLLGILIMQIRKELQEQNA